MNLYGKYMIINDEWIMKRNALNDKITNYKNIKKFFENCCVVF